MTPDPLRLIASTASHRSTARILCAWLGLTACTLLAPLHAEVKEELYGKSQGYPYQAGWPFNAQPPYRVGASGGRAVAALYANRPVWMAPAEVPAPLPRQAVKFGFLHDPQDLMKREAIMAMLLIKNGKVVFEQYQYGTQADSLFDSQSIAKTMTALAIGIAMDRGEIRSLNDRMGDLVPRLKPSPIGAATLRQTLQMQCGHKFKFNAEGADSSAGQYAAVKFATKARGGRDLYAYMQDIEPVPPGSRFAYDPHCSDALSMLITQISGRPLRQYFEEHVWSKLKPTSRAAWLGPNQNPELTSGANSLYISLQDWGLLAQLFVNGGTLNGTRIVSEQWMQAMVADTVTVGKEENENFARYGYQTWVRTGEPDSWFAGLGHLGKRFYIDRKNQSALLIFGLEYDHIKASDRFWEWFRKTPLDKL